MPIYSPTGFLDITNATLRTSNTECQNLKIGTGNLYVTSEISPDFELNLSNVTNLGATSPHTLILSNVTTAIDATSNIITSGNLKIGGLIYTKDWGFRTANGSTGNQYVGRFTALGITEVLITDQGGSLGSSSKYTITRNINSIPLVNGIDSSSTVNYEWYYSPVPGGSIYDLWVRPIYSSSVQTNIKVTSSTYTEVAEPTSVTLIPCVNGLITMSGNVVANQNLTVSGNTFYTSPVSINVDSNVVTEYTGPHDRPQRKYPEIILPRSAVGAEYNGYRIDRSSEHVTVPYDGVQDLFNETAVDYADTWGAGWQGTSGAYSTSTGEHTTFVTGGTTQGTGANLSSSSGVPNGEWVSLKTPNAIKLDNIQIRSRNATDWYAQFPSDFQIWGSNNGTTWSHVKTFTGQAASGQSVLHTYTVNSTIFYNRHALVVTKIPGTASTIVVSTGHAHFSISELRFNAKEEGSASLDTTLKTVYNVPATTGAQLEVYYDAKDLTTMPSTVTDLSPNTNNATLGGDPQVSNGAFVFDGSGDAVISGATSFSGSPTLSYSVWFKTNSILSGTGSNSIVMIGHADGGKSLGFRIKGTGDTNPGNYRFYVYGGATNESVETDIKAQIGIWTHATIVRDGLNMKLYIDGKFVDENTNTTTNLALNSGARVALGNYINSSGAVTTISANDSYDGSIANFRLYSKALNADQVKELYDYQKDYFLGSKSQLTLYKGHLGVGVTEPSGQLELAGDERIQEYPPRSLRQYSTQVEGHGVFNVLASAEYNQNADNDRAWKMFTKIADASNYWTPASDGYDASNGNATSASPSTDGTAGHWVQLELPYKVKLHSVKIAAGISTRQAKNATVFGSNDGGNTWTNVGGWTNNNVSDFSLVTFSMNNVGYYNLYRLVVTKNGGNAALTLSELQFFGTPGPTTLDKGSLSLGRSLDVPRVSRYDVDTETPRPEKLVLDLDTTVNSTPTDISGKGNHGAFYGNAQYSPADKAFEFDGSTDYIKGNLNNTGDTDFTVSLWLKKNTSGTVGMLWNFGGSGGSGNPEDSVALEVGSNNNLDYFIFSGAQGAISNFGVDYLGKWVHIVATRSGNNLEIYLDGVDQNLAITGTDTLQLAANTEYTIGARGTGALGNNSLNGCISNFKVYNVVLEPSEIKKLYRLGRTGRSMVISDTAVGIGKAPEAQLDVRGNMTVRGDVNIPSGRFTIHRFMGSGIGTFGGSGNITLPFELDYGPNNPAIGWEIRLAFGASGTNYGKCSISGCYDNEDTLTGVSEAFSLQLRTTNTNWSDHGSECFLSRRETVAPAYQAIIRIVNPLAENIPAPSSGSSYRWHFSYECTGCYANTGATTIRGGGYFLFGAADRRIKNLILNSATGSISGHYNFVAIS